MRTLAFLFALCLIFNPVLSAHAADYSNDSDSININYTGGTPTPPPSDAPPADQPPADSGSSGSGGTGSDAGNAGSTDVTVQVTVVTDPNAGGGSGGSSSGSGTATGGGSADSSGQTGGTSGSAEGNQNQQGSGGTGGSQSFSSSASGASGGAVTASDIVSTLQGNQAVIFGQGASSSGTSGTGAGGGGITAQEAFGTVTLSGKKVRAALSARSVTDIILGTALGQRYLTKGDATIAAASAILKNSALEEVVLSLQTISFTYTAQGRLFAVFPIDYPLKVTVNPAGTTVDERVRLGFPWYTFFLQTFISKNALQAGIDAAVRGVVANADGAVDAQSKLVAAVNETLQNSLIR